MKRSEAIIFVDGAVYNGYISTVFLIVVFTSLDRNDMFIFFKKLFVIIQQKYFTVMSLNYQ